MADAETVDAVAKAIYMAHAAPNPRVVYPADPPPWENQHDEVRRYVTKMAEHAIALLQARGWGPPAPPAQPASPQPPEPAPQEPSNA